jgi:putative membrane protein
MHAHRPLLAAVLIAAGTALAQGTTGGGPSTPQTNPAPNDTGSMSAPPGMSGTERHPADNQATGQPMIPPASSALGTTPAPGEILAELHMANASEVDLGKVAEQRAQSKDVKAFGKRMVKDHTALDKDARSWAKKNKVTVGAAPQDDMRKMQDLKQRLESLSGAEFDKTYMQAMAEDHANDLNKVQTFEQQTTDKSLKKLLEKARKVIASHKKDADKLVQKLGATASR